MAVGRSGHAAILLGSGKVLVMGGVGSCSNSAEIYNPTAGVWESAANMAECRTSAAAALLNDGTVLVVGGNNAEIYDPTSNTWRTVSSMQNAESGVISLTKLPNGTVLAAGFSRVPETYDPQVNVWTTTGSMTKARSGFTTTLMTDGGVLITGGVSDSSAEMYDSASRTWTAISQMAVPWPQFGGRGRQNHAAALIPPNRVLVVGGSPYCSGIPEMYRPAVSLSWIQAGPMVTTPCGRSYHTGTTLTNGNVLVTGGDDSAGSLSSAEIYYTGR